MRAWPHPRSYRGIEALAHWRGASAGKHAAEAFEDHFIARGDITMGNGYSVGDEPQAHFGLGDIKACDVVVTWQGRRVVVRDVKPNQYLDVVVGDKR